MYSKTIAEKFTLDYNNSIYLKYKKNIEGTNEIRPTHNEKHYVLYKLFFLFSVFLHLLIPFL